jgi:proteasome lid subunit RPN8/RPN11
MRRAGRILLGNERKRQGIISSVLILTGEQWAQICAHLSAKLPEEACGLLAGRDGRTLKVFLIPNAAHSPTRFMMAPAHLLQALEEIDEAGWDLLGIFHSHPAGPPAPSPTDVAEAYYPDSAYLICAPGPHGWQVGTFEIRDGQTREIPLEIK